MVERSASAGQATWYLQAGRDRDRLAATADQPDETFQASNNAPMGLEGLTIDSHFVTN